LRNGHNFKRGYVENTFILPPPLSPPPSARTNHKLACQSAHQPSLSAVHKARYPFHSRLVVFLLQFEHARHQSNEFIVLRFFYWVGEAYVYSL
jgi:hypothetical protein